MWRWKLAQVKHWIRNVAKRPNAFWLPLASGKFNPDFVAELTDGRIFVVKYKGQRGIEDPSEREKLGVGQLWQFVSNGSGVFCRVEIEAAGPDMRGQMQEAISRQSWWALLSHGEVLNVVYFLFLINYNCIS